eukprot:TRINITY_DN1306_c0_g2_i1.p1 TRINITY_DN1306_c0_g2~~TRINITY_DN1306_c0_g2_i1.p1  ORF type:complete len:474 (+),score=147.85 TRINITY_DN1306_c0_g2_i1:42-1424(+)
MDFEQVFNCEKDFIEEKLKELSENQSSDELKRFVKGLINKAIEIHRFDIFIVCLLTFPIVFDEIIVDKPVKVLEGHSLSIYSIDSNNHLLVSCSRDHKTQIYNIQNDFELLEQIEFPKELYDVNFSQDKTLLSIVCIDGRIRIYDVIENYDLKLKTEICLTFSFYNKVKITPDNKYLIGGDNRGYIHFHDIETGEKLKELRIFSDVIFFLDVNPHGEILVVSRHLGKLLTSEGEVIFECSKLPFNSSLAFSSNGKNLLLIEEDSVNIFDILSKTNILTIPIQNPIHVRYYNEDNNILIINRNNSSENYRAIGYDLFGNYLFKIELCPTQILNCNVFKSGAGDEYLAIGGDSTLPHVYVYKFLKKTHLLETSETIWNDFAQEIVAYSSKYPELLGKFFFQNVISMQEVRKLLTMGICLDKECFDSIIESCWDLFDQNEQNGGNFSSFVDDDDEEDDEDDED